MNIDNFTITSFDQLTGFSRTDKTLKLLLDELNDFTLSQEEDKSEITGRGGRTVGTLKKNKKVTGKGTNGYLSGGALAVMTGTEIEDGEYNRKYTDRVIVKSNKATTAETAAGTAGDEIGTIYVRDANQTYISGGKKLTQVASTPKTGEFTYTPDSKEITFFAGDVADGTEVVMFYDVKVTGKKISNDSENYSEVLNAFIDVTCTDVCDKLFHGQFIIPRADFDGTFDIAGGSDPAVQNFGFTSLPDKCSGKTDLWDFIVFD